ncbi:hypothetical protein FOMA001_g3279 [Fusarium oxysporum f. sp. matthiolae]|nr:hypothetical protein FOMA001_g3279 [Fusarium oxysporum f. sp. matthiolae]
MTVIGYMSHPSTPGFASPRTQEHVGSAAAQNL